MGIDINYLKKEQISDIIYNYLDYMYCDNCRYDSEITDDDCHCEDCHRKMNRWGISRATCDILAEKISNGFKLSIENMKIESLD